MQGCCCGWGGLVDGAQQHAAATGSAARWGWGRQWLYGCCNLQLQYWAVGRRQSSPLAPVLLCQCCCPVAARLMTVAVQQRRVVAQTDRRTTRTIHLRRHAAAGIRRLWMVFWVWKTCGRQPVKLWSTASARKPGATQASPTCGCVASRDTHGCGGHLL